MVIWKFSIAISSEITTISIPSMSHCCFVAMKDGDLCLWFQVPDINNPKVVRKFQVFGTGGRIPDLRIYIGSVLQGPYVWHIYEVS